MFGTAGNWAANHKMYHPVDQFFRRTIQRTQAKMNSDMNCQPLQSGDIYVFNIRRPFSYCNIVIIPYHSHIIATSFTALEMEPCFAIFWDVGEIDQQKLCRCPTVPSWGIRMCLTIVTCTGWLIWGLTVQQPIGT